jgi:hypothetical protein
MSEDQTTQQMLLLEDSHANHSALQENEKEQTMIATSGMKLLESLPNANRGGLLEKMLKDLLTSTTAWSSDRCKLIWKSKVSKSNVLLFQLQASVLGIKGKESGLLPTPTTMDHIDRKGMRPSRAATNRKTGYLSEMIKMYPTPRAADVEGGAVKNVQLENGHFFRENSKGVRWGVKLRDAVEMYPTPTTRDYKDSTVSKSHQNRNSDSLPIKMMREAKPGGKLNPNFVEFLMGYPMNWTKIDQAE